MSVGLLTLPQPKRLNSCDFTDILLWPIYFNFRGVLANKVLVFPVREQVLSRSTIFHTQINLLRKGRNTFFAQESIHFVSRPHPEASVRVSFQLHLTVTFFAQLSLLTLPKPSKISAQKTGRHHTGSLKPSKRHK